jgi:hypothetical protein
LERRQSDDGVVYYASAILDAVGVRHAFSTRIGGLSPAPFDSLNLGNPNGCSLQDEYSRIWANYALLQKAIDVSTDPPLRVHQVHGNSVARAECDRAFDVDARADAIVTQDSSRPISVRTADCVPILLATSDGKTVAAVHAGWRGIVAGVLPAAVAHMLTVAKGTSTDSLFAAIGPCIGPQAFEVGSEVLGEFTRTFGPAAPIHPLPDGKGLVDLKQAARLQLLECGLIDDCIDSTDRCTVTHRDEFFSHRRDAGITGRMAAVIACKS